MSNTLVRIIDGKTPFEMSPQHLAFHTPAKRGDRGWVIMEKDTQRVIDRYTPERKVRPKPITPYEGSWAHTMAQSKT